MDQTPNHSLPYIMAAQAQKHVTHNEALRVLDAILQLSVADRGLTTPPATPSDGDRYIVAAGATGGWAGKDLEIAAFQDGLWMFYPPQAGWLAYIEDEGELLVWDGAAWAVVSSSGGGGTGGPYTKLGINATADNTNRLTVKSDAVLLSHDDVTPGTGDLRNILNKAQSTNTASFLFQTGFSGRAEIGLTGDDDLHVKASADGAAWSEAMVVDAATGMVSFPNGTDVAPSANLLINACFAVNQRAFGGGALSAGAYGHDRWKAGGSGATYTVAGEAVTITAGALQQVIEAPGLAGQTVAFSVEDVAGGPLVVDVEGQTATVPVGNGRQNVTLSLPLTATGNVTVEISPSSGATTFKRPKLEGGNFATPFAVVSAADEIAQCHRYFQVLKVSLNTGTGGGTVTYAVPLRPEMARAPDKTRVSAFISSTETGTQFTGGTTNSAVSFGVFNGGTGGVGGVFHLNAEL